jgi:hypothetical protein
MKAAMHLQVSTPQGNAGELTQEQGAICACLLAPYLSNEFARGLFTGGAAKPTGQNR